MAIEYLQEGILILVYTREKIWQKTRHDVNLFIPFSYIYIYISADIFVKNIFLQCF